MQHSAVYICSIFHETFADLLLISLAKTSKTEKQIPVDKKIPSSATNYDTVLNFTLEFY